jgi:hypothetical protein
MCSKKQLGMATELRSTPNHCDTTFVVFYSIITKRVDMER